MRSDRRGGSRGGNGIEGDRGSAGSADGGLGVTRGDDGSGEEEVCWRDRRSGWIGGGAVESG